MSLDSEEQDDELLALASIYEESFTSTQAQEGDQADPHHESRGGELAISLDLPQEFCLLSRHTDENGESGSVYIFMRLDSLYCIIWNLGLVNSPVYHIFIAFVPLRLFFSDIIVYYYLNICFSGTVLEQRTAVEHLPPIYLHFTYPPTYPSEQPPNFTISCKWLNRSQVRSLVNTCFNCKQIVKQLCCLQYLYGKKELMTVVW